MAEIQCERCGLDYDPINPDYPHPCPACRARQRAILNPLKDAIHEALGKLRREYVSADMAGERPSCTYEDLKADLEDAVGLVRITRDHAHDWNEDDYCNVCGADGRA